jgi:hypothetical protein
MGIFLFPVGPTTGRSVVILLTAKFLILELTTKLLVSENHP